MAAIKADLVNATKRLDGNKTFFKSKQIFNKPFTTFTATQQDLMNAESGYAKQMKGNYHFLNI
jgi:hypothetical protein